jgi:hypothetical protein
MLRYRKPSCLRIAAPALILATLSLALPASAVSAKRTYFAVKVRCDIATFRLVGLKPATVRAARVTLGQRTARVKPAVVRRAARRGTLRLRLSTLPWTSLRRRTNTRRNAEPRRAERDQRARPEKHKGCRNRGARQAGVRRKRPKLTVITLDPPNSTDPVSTAEATPVKRRICMNIHANYGGIYGNVQQVKADLDYLGVDCVRDQMPPSDTRANPDRWNALDVQVIAYCGGYFSTWQWEGREAECVRMFADRVKRPVAVEGMNEPYCGDFDAIRAQGDRLKAHMMRIRDAALDTSNGRRPIDPYTVALCNQDGWYAGNIPGMVNAAHTYTPCGDWPNDSRDTFQIGWYQQFPISDSRRWASTEAGRNLGCVSGQTEHAQVNLVAALLHLDNGYERTALYQLYDEGPQAPGTCCTFGFWSATHQKRQVADALHNFMVHLGNAIVVGTSGYSVSDPAGELEHMAFEDAAGRRFVALWNRVRVSSARNVTVTLDAAHTAGVIDPVASDAVTPLAGSAAHTVSLGNSPLLLRIDP